MRILLIDDSQSVRYMVKAGIERALKSSEVVVWDPIEQGLPEESMDLSGFDWMIMDYDLGLDSSGLDWFSVMVDYPNCPPSILISGLAPDSLREEATLLGMHSFIRKDVHLLGELLKFFYAQNEQSGQNIAAGNAH